MPVLTPSAGVPPPGVPPGVPLPASSAFSFSWSSAMAVCCAFSSSIARLEKA